MRREVIKVKSNSEIKKLMEWDIRHFKDPEEYFLFGLGEIEHHIPELRELNAKKDPHLYDEIADVHIWAQMLLMANNVGEDIVLKRVNRFREKIAEHRLSLAIKKYEKRIKKGGAGSEND